MSRKPAMLRYLFTLLLAVSIMAPQMSVAQETPTVGSATPVAEINIEEPNADDPSIDPTEVDDGAEAPAPVGPANTGSSFSLLADPGTGDPEYYCDFTNKPAQGTIADWWQSKSVAPDCIDLEIINSPATCSLTANFGSWVYTSVSGNPATYTDALTWYETDANGKVLREGDLPYPSPPLNTGTTGRVGPAGGSFTVKFAEDYRGGTAYVLINFNSPERDIEPGLEQIDIDHWRSTSAGVVYKINTDCEDPVPVNFCDYTQIVGAGSVFDWLSGAPEGANTDCIDVGTAIQACGSLDIPFESRVTGIGSGYYLLWAEGTVIPTDDSLWHDTWPIVFPEDADGGSVDVIVFIAGPEDDYYHFADEEPYPYPYPVQDLGDIPARSLGGGMVYTIQTDCIRLAELALPEITPSVCDANHQATPTKVVAPADSESVTYSDVTVVAKTNGGTFSITATANPGFTFVGAEMPEGWVMISASEAVYEVVVDAIDCKVPPTETPDKEDTKEPEKPKDVTKLPETGSGSSSASLIGLAAAAAAAIAGAGLYGTNRKR